MRRTLATFYTGASSCVYLCEEAEEVWGREEEGPV